jgi:hypothetical protein
MSEQKPQLITPDQVGAQVDKYLNDESLHVGSSMHGNLGGAIHSHSLREGDVSRVDGNHETTRHLEARGSVDGQNLTSDIVTTDFGIGARVNRASTSDNSSRYSTWAEKDAGVSRKTKNGDEYLHRFKDPSKIKEASKLITSLASKRAAKVIEGPRQKAA